MYRRFRLQGRIRVKQTHESMPSGSRSLLHAAPYGCRGFRLQGMTRGL